MGQILLILSKAHNPYFWAKRMVRRRTWLAKVQPNTITSMTICLVLVGVYPLLIKCHHKLLFSKLRTTITSSTRTSLVQRVTGVQAAKQLSMLPCKIMAYNKTTSEMAKNLSTRHRIMVLFRKGMCQGAGTPQVSKVVKAGRRRGGIERGVAKIQMKSFWRQKNPTCKEPSAWKTRLIWTNDSIFVSNFLNKNLADFNLFRGFICLTRYKI